MRPVSRRTILAGLAVAGVGTYLGSSADAATANPSQGAIRDVLARHLEQRASLVTSRPSYENRASLTEMFSHPEPYGDSQALVVERASTLSRGYGGYGRAQTMVDIIALTPEGASRVHVSLRERTALTFTQRRRPGLQDELYVCRHEAIMVLVGGRWKIESISPRPDYLCFLPITQLPSEAPAGTPTYPISDSHGATMSPSDAPATESGAVTSELKGSPSGVRPDVGGYNYAAMRNYAFRWFGDYNRAYPTYSGDDCTNFISQCVQAGGWQIVNGPVTVHSDDHYWFYNTNSIWPSSYSWGAAQNWRNFSFNSGRVASLSSAYSMGMGDVLGYDFDHNGVLDHLAMCIDHNNGNPCMAQHSGGYYNKPLSQILAVAGSSGWALYPERT